MTELRETTLQQLENFIPYKVNLQKALEFWEWWLTEAIPGAWSLAHQNLYALEFLLKQSLEFVQNWLEQVWSGRVSPGEDFFWHGLAEGASSKATQASYVSSDEDRISWATIAIKVYAYMVNTLHSVATVLL